VYILECADKSYYTGITNNAEKRVEEHNIGIDRNSYTYIRRPVKLVFCERFVNSLEAIQFEKQLKGWSRNKKEALITNKLDLLSELSKSKMLIPSQSLRQAQDDNALGQSKFIKTVSNITNHHIK
jgi:putative endonuclease